LFLKNTKSDWGCQHLNALIYLQFFSKLITKETKAGEMEVEADKTGGLKDGGIW